MLHGFPCTRPSDSGQRPVRSSTLARTDDEQHHGEQRVDRWRSNGRRPGFLADSRGVLNRLVGARAGRDPGWVLRLEPRARQSECHSTWFQLSRLLSGASSGGPGSRPAQRFQFTTWSRVEEQGRLLALGQTPPRGFRSNFFRGLDSSSPPHGPAKPEPREGGEQGWESVGLSPTLRC